MLIKLQEFGQNSSRVLFVGTNTYYIPIRTTFLISLLMDEQSHDNMHNMYFCEINADKKISV